MFTARTRSLGQSNIFTGICLSTRGSFCMMSLPVWLPGPMLLLGGICAWSHVPSRGVSVQRVVSVQGGLCPGGSLSRGVSVQGVSLTETPPPRTLKNRQYASYWNAFLYFLLAVTVFSRLNICETQLPSTY